MYSANGSLDWRTPMPRPRLGIGLIGFRRAISGIANHWAEHCANSALIGGLAIGFTTPWLVERACFCCVWRRQAQASLRHSACTRILEGLQGEDAHTVKSKTKGKAKDITSVSDDECMIRELREDPKFAVEYLKVALEDTEEPGVLLIALRRIAEARGGIAKVAKAAGIERESLYRALSAKGNPRLSTLVAVTKAVGLRLTVEPAP